MSMRRFAPNLVCSLEGRYLFVDHIQPVAALVGDQGSVESVVDWRDLAETPRKDDAPWPTRTLHSSQGGNAWLTEAGEDYCIEFDVDSTGSLTASRRDDWTPTGSEKTQRSRFSLSGEVVDSDGPPEQVAVRFKTTLHEFTWTASVVAMPNGSYADFVLGRGAVTSCDAIGHRSSALCVRRADKRPWSFTPEFDMYIIQLEGGGAQKVPSFDVSDRSWAPHLPDLLGHDRAYFGGYLEFTHAECDALVRHGARDVSYRVLEMDKNPLIEIRSHFDSVGSHEVVRVDRPFDELGRRSRGLLGLGIFVDDDFTGDIIGALARADGPTLI